MPDTIMLEFYTLTPIDRPKQGQCHQPL